ncbi:phage tail protein [Enterococcus diestrammenae]|uniref:phage tail protein n=1 Tax=Enterococcus diestrammenae TaxID=1155073 RepID=UPI00195A63BC
MMTTPDNVGVEPVYSEIVRLPIATKLGIKGNGSTLEKWASSKMFRMVSRETKHEIALDHVGIPIEVMDELKGLVAVNAATFGTTQSREYPFFAFGFIGNMEGGGKKAVWYPKTQLSNVIDEEYETAEEETKINDVTANLVSVGLKNNGVIYSSFDSNRTDGSLELFEKFIKQPVYSETQWTTLAGGE